MQGQALLDYIKRVNDLEAEIYANHQILSQFSQAASKKSPPKPAEPKYIAIQEPVPPPKPTAVKETEFSKTAIAKAMIILLLLGVVLFAVGMFLSLEYRYEEIAKNLIIFGAFLLGMGAFINLATKAERSGDPGAFNDCIIFTIPQIIDMYNAEYRKAAGCDLLGECLVKVGIAFLKCRAVKTVAQNRSPTDNVCSSFKLFYVPLFHFGFDAVAEGFGFFLCVGDKGFPFTECFDFADDFIGRHGSFSFLDLDLRFIFHF